MRLGAWLGAVLVVAVAVGALVWVAPWPGVYVVERGDTLGEIAAEHGVTVDELKRWNGLKSDLIEVDQRLLVWRGAPEASSEPAPSKPAPRPRPAPVAGGGSPAAAPDVREPGLELPPEKPCLAAPSDELDGVEAGLVASRGLSREQVSEALGAFAPHLGPCLGGDRPSATLNVTLRVACTGRVAEVHTGAPGDWAAEAVRCVRDRLRFAPFPAHGLPDGEEILYPLRVTDP